MSDHAGPAAGEPAGVPQYAWLGMLNRTTMWACEALLVAMMALIIAEIVARSFFSISLQFVDEYASYALVWLTFLGISVALHDGALFSVGIVYDRLASRLRAALKVLWDLFALAVSAVLVWQSIRQVLSSYEREMVAPTVIATPLWLPQLALPIGSALLMVVLGSIATADIARLMRGR